MYMCSFFDVLKDQIGKLLEAKTLFSNSLKNSAENILELTGFISITF